VTPLHTGKIYRSFINEKQQEASLLKSGVGELFLKGQIVNIPDL
jgi:hypothetical protein